MNVLADAQYDWQHDGVEEVRHHLRQRGLGLHRPPPDCHLQGIDSVLKWINEGKHHKFRRDTFYYGTF